MIRQKAPNDKTGDDAMVLTMIDWRDCAVIEYVPERVSGRPSFLGCRLQVDVLMLLYFANRVLVGEPVVVSGGELMVVVEASFEL